MTSSFPFSSQLLLSPNSKSWKGIVTFIGTRVCEINLLLKMEVKATNMFPFLSPNDFGSWVSIIMLVIKSTLICSAMRVTTSENRMRCVTCKTIERRKWRNCKWRRDMWLILVFIGMSVERVAIGALTRVLVKVGDEMLFRWVWNASHPNNVLILEFKKENMVVWYNPDPMNGLPHILFYGPICYPTLKLQRKNVWELFF